jgi:hypothetical protein
VYTLGDADDDDAAPPNCGESSSQTDSISDLCTVSDNIV